VEGTGRAALPRPPVPPPFQPPFATQNGAVCRPHYPRELKLNPSGRAEKCRRSQPARLARDFSPHFVRDAIREGRCCALIVRTIFSMFFNIALKIERERERFIRLY